MSPNQHGNLSVIVIDGTRPFLNSMSLSARGHSIMKRRQRLQRSIVIYALLYGTVESHKDQDMCTKSEISEEDPTSAVYGTTPADPTCRATSHAARLGSL